MPQGWDGEHCARNSSCGQAGLDRCTHSRHPAARFEWRRRTRNREGRRLMGSAISANKAELLAIANAVASEKMIDKAIVIEAMEEAIQKSARNRYGAENDMRAKLEPVTGDLRLRRGDEAVEAAED